MTTKKKIILFASIAGCAVLLGVIAALIFSSLGTGTAFQNGGTCAAKEDRSSEAALSETEDTQIIIVSPDDPETTPEETLPAGTPVAGTTPAPTATPSPTVDPYEELLEKADPQMMKDIVNILLIGVDYSTERETWNGKKEWHSDVMMILAVNFAENRADLISLPRDTYASIPGVKGIYKLNASLNCGGGLYNADGSENPKGLEKVCEAAEWMLGGDIPVDYYYAVTMTSLKDLVDLCGGLDYDMDIKFHIQGRYYEKGLQHIDGQGFLDYCRVRKAENGLSVSETTDARRVDRQKRMLIAMFRQMKADQMITKIPEIVDTFDGDLFTNCTFAQTASLAAFAYNLDPENIGMYSMSGTLTSLFQWNFCFTNQANRVDIINKVYHQKVKQYSQYTLQYGRYRWCDLLYTHYKELLDPLTKYVQKQIDEDDLIPEETPEPSESPTDETPPPTDTPAPDPTDPPEPDPTDTPAPDPTDPPEPDPTEPDDSGNGGALNDFASRGVVYATNGEGRMYSAEDRDLFEQYKTCIKELEEIRTEANKEAKKARNGKSNDLTNKSQQYLKKLEEVQTLAIKVAKTFDYTKVKNITTPFAPTGSGWGNSPWAYNYGKNKKFNEVIVDFN
ncbi:MAG: LCP family protein [Clostridia bacterium]|nr:LCP family protein [Clostridia bacterium]